MLKSELLELIKDVEDGGNIDEIITSNGFAKPLIFSDKTVATVDELKSLIDSERDKGIEGFKKNGMRKLIDEEISKRNGENETPEQKAIRELTEKLENMEKEKARAEMTSKFKDILTEKNIPCNLIELVLGDNEEATNANIKLLEDTMQSHIDKQVQDRLNGSYKPPKDDGNSDDFEKQIAEVMGIK